MTSIMDYSENVVDPQAEVEKLKDLVKKLETQNEVLRSKQKLGSEYSTNDILKQSVNNSVFYNTRKQHPDIDRLIDKPATNNANYLESTELIDVDKFSNEDSEDSWLYTSPRPPTPQQNRMSPYKWVRLDFDNPSPDIQSARKCLKFKLDEVARMSRSSSTPAFQNYTTPPQANPVAMSLSADSATPPSPRIMSPSARLSPAVRASLPAGKINTGTFTRPKRAKEMMVDGAAMNGEESKENVEAIHHPNVADIENLAKQQEESLRQSMAQTSPRRDGLQRRNSNNSVGSENSSPPDSPYGSSQHLHQNHSGGSNLRGSLPNVSRLIPRSQHHNSDSSLNDYQQEDAGYPESLKYNSRLAGPLQRPSSPSVSGLRQPQKTTRGASPQRSGLPTPRRGIPRPGSAGTPRSGLQAPRRISGLPAPNTPGRQYTPQKMDDSWREGCF